MSVRPRSACEHESSATFLSDPKWKYLEKFSPFGQVDHYDAKKSLSHSNPSEQLTEQDSEWIEMTKLTILSLEHDMLYELWTGRNTHDKDRFQGVAGKRRQTQ
jgi:hypothetical protein